MNNLDFLVIYVHKIIDSGLVNSSIRHEMDPNSKEVISRTYFSTRDINFSITRRDNLFLNYQRFQECEVDINICKLMENEVITLPKPFLNIPTMIRCQNCETSFPTKYQYQRHQCEFNAEKVVLKPEVDVKEEDKSAQVKFICQICDRQFVSRTNLERHEVSHEKNQENICENCNKKFVSENRLRIHKENHCKKAGDISKFYRSDVTVWKCKKCSEVFSAQSIANFHISNCTGIPEIVTLIPEDAVNYKTPHTEEKNAGFEALQEQSIEASSQTDNKFIEKILTEILFQCEFCNRTYSEKNQLLIHQKKHTTSKNYECSNCCSAFDSYATAAQHWLKRCTEYVNIFFLPRFTFCECCDRPFKSHEQLYTHKIKKKHYTPKVHLSNPKSDYQDSLPPEKLTENHTDGKEVLSKLIEDVLKTLDVPINKMKNSTLFGNHGSCSSEDPNSTNEETFDLTTVKKEIDENLHVNSTNGDVGEKKKRGRKRKWIQRPQKETQTSSLENGLKFQCERCVHVFDTIPEMDTHRDKEHASTFSCEECGQVVILTCYKFIEILRYWNNRF